MYDFGSSAPASASVNKMKQAPAKKKCHHVCNPKYSAGKQLSSGALLHNPLNMYEVMKMRKSISDSKKASAAEELKKVQHAKMYRFGFWVFFFLVIFSVLFSVWAITSIYADFKVVTKILDESFDRTNFVLDITSGKIASCENQLTQCRANSS